MSSSYPLGVFPLSGILCIQNVATSFQKLLRIRKQKLMRNEEIKRCEVMVDIAEQVKEAS